MIAAACSHKDSKKFGKNKFGVQRFRCHDCGCVWLADQHKPLGDMRLDKAAGVLCLRLLLEGNSIRSVERVTHVHRDTILKLLETVGKRAMVYWENEMKNLPAMDVQCDEIWGFVGCKEKTRVRKDYGKERGDAYCFTAIERSSKLLLTWHLGKRSPQDTEIFADKLRSAVAGRCQVTTDGFGPYVNAIPNAFAGQIDYAQLIKIYGSNPDGPSTRYSPARIVDVRLHSVCGNPNAMEVCTSHVERHNLSIRMAIRRMTRLTNAHSKKWANHEYALAIWLLYYNFCRVHQTIKTTPAVKAGIAQRVWSVEDLLDNLANQG